MNITKKTLGDDIYVFKSVIRVHTGIKEAQIKGQSILSYDPKSIGAKDYNSFANEFLEVVNRGKE